MNYDPRWSTYPPQPMYGYPPAAGPTERVVFMPAPKSKSEMKEFLKFQKIMKELEEGKKKPEEKKKEDDKKPALAYLQQVAVAFAISPFIIFANAMIILFIVKAFKGI